jgi:hypothetical protein
MGEKTVGFGGGDKYSRILIVVRKRAMDAQATLPQTLFGICSIILFLENSRLLLLCCEIPTISLNPHQYNVGLENADIRHRMKE